MGCHFSPLGCHEGSLKLVQPHHWSCIFGGVLVHICAPTTRDPLGRKFSWTLLVLNTRSADSINSYFAQYKCNHLLSRISGHYYPIYADPPSSFGFWPPTLRPQPFSLFSPFRLTAPRLPTVWRLPRPAFGVAPTAYLLWFFILWSLTNLDQRWNPTGRTNSPLFRRCLSVIITGWTRFAFSGPGDHRSLRICGCRLAWAKDADRAWLTDNYSLPTPAVNLVPFWSWFAASRLRAAFWLVFVTD